MIGIYSLLDTSSYRFWASAQIRFDGSRGNSTGRRFELPMHRLLAVRETLRDTHERGKTREGIV